MMASLLSSFPGLTGWRLARMRSRLQQIESFESTFRDQPDEKLKKASSALKYRARSGERLVRLMPEAYALVREAARRTLQMRHFDVQLLGGIALAQGSVAEMETGEGKTLTASLPLYLYALAGKGAHLATVNDYLAQRDANLNRPIYELLGLSVGVIHSQMPPPDRRAAYACDITYGTAKEFGFDFLRDCLLLRRNLGLQGLTLHQPADRSQREQPLQRSPFFALVDEADSVLIDEARTPLIIGSVDETTREQVVTSYRWSAEMAEQFTVDQHYEYDHEKKTVELNVAGRQLVRALEKPRQISSVGLADLYEFIERAIKVNRDFTRDRQYVIHDGEIAIVDEYTGRIAEGRKWRNGIHQAIEAKEKVEVTIPTGQAARITIQDLVMRYRYLAGMTGTAQSSAGEFRKVYKLPVVTIPTNKPVRRKHWPDRLFAKADDKWSAIVDEVRELHKQGRPVLIGTRSIDKSEYLSRLLAECKIEHRVLNARQIAAEQDIVASAGQRGTVTVATNMAGRGTDIKLGDGVAELGGLHVICTEYHDAQRIDRQLAGRCGRQGDPGSVRQYLSLDDDIIRNAFGPKRAEQIAKQGDSAGKQGQAFIWLFGRAQRRIERLHFRGRMVLLHHERQRKQTQREIGQNPYLDTPD